jgi:hypothetical protein
MRSVIEQSAAHHRRLRRLVKIEAGICTADPSALRERASKPTHHCRVRCVIAKLGKMSLNQA